MPQSAVMVMATMKFGVEIGVDEPALCWIVLRDAHTATHQGQPFGNRHRWMVRGQARASRDDVMVRPSQRTRAAAGALTGRILESDRILESGAHQKVAQKFGGKDPHYKSIVVHNKTEVDNLNEQYRRRL
jgi:hypothetical protein